MPHHHHDHHHPTRKPTRKPKPKPKPNPQSKPPSPLLTHLPHKPLTLLDGSTLEGGGQLLRNALALSCLTRTPLHIPHVRANRPGPVQGLKRSHLCAVEALARLAGAEVYGGEVGSEEVVFVPGPGPEPGPEPEPEPGGVGTGTGTGRRGEEEEEEEERKGDVWRKLESEEGWTVEMQTMGSVWLVWQALMPVLLFPPDSDRDLSARDGDGKGGEGEKRRRKRIRLRLRGGTFASFAPTTFYVRHVLIPTLRRVVGIRGLSVDVIREGFSTGPKTRDRGEAVIDVEPFALGECINAFSISDRGRIKRLGICIAAHEQVIGAVEAETRAALEEAIRQGRFSGEKNLNLDVGEDEEIRTEIKIDIQETLITSSPSHLSLLVFAETSSSYSSSSARAGGGGGDRILARDCLWEKKVKAPLNPQAIQSTARTLARKVVDDLASELESTNGNAACVDEHMADQLVVFQALSQGKGRVDCGRGDSLHARTARWVARGMLGEGEGRCWFAEEDGDGGRYEYEGSGYRGLSEWMGRGRAKKGEGKVERNNGDGDGVDIQRHEQDSNAEGEEEEKEGAQQGLISSLKETSIS